MTLATVAEAKRVVRIENNGPARALEPPVWVDCTNADAIYADALDVVIEQGPKVWRFETSDAATAERRARELAVFANLRGARQ